MLNEKLGGVTVLTSGIPPTDAVKEVALVVVPEITEPK
jgi:hypothetical protein